MAKPGPEARSSNPSQCYLLCRFFFFFFLVSKLKELFPFPGFCLSKQRRQEAPEVRSVY